VWLRAFLRRERGSLIRTFVFAAFTMEAKALKIGVDASPWGIGAFLELHGEIVEWFSSKLTPLDEEILHIVIGEAAAQQAAEALAVLVALRLWGTHWRAHNVRLEVRSDSMTALMLCFNMKAKGVGCNVIARELALTLGASVHRPRIFSHTPGIANILADALSRRYQPGVQWHVPEALADVAETQAPLRARPTWLSVR
jgi:hypothetical protein